MATENKGKCITVEAGSDLSASQFRFMNINSSNQLVAASAGAAADGVLQNKPDAAGRAGELMVGIGDTKIECGAATTAGGDAAVGTSGKAVDATTGDVVVGTFREAAGADGDVVKLLLKNAGATA